MRNDLNVIQGMYTNEYCVCYLVLPRLHFCSSFQFCCQDLYLGLKTETSTFKSSQVKTKTLASLWSRVKFNSYQSTASFVTLNVLIWKSNENIILTLISRQDQYFHRLVSRSRSRLQLQRLRSRPRLLRKQTQVVLIFKTMVSRQQDCSFLVLLLNKEQHFRKYVTIIKRVELVLFGPLLATTRTEYEVSCL
jgi:hypothetical protein